MEKEYTVLQEFQLERNCTPQRTERKKEDKMPVRSKLRHFRGQDGHRLTMENGSNWQNPRELMTVVAAITTATCAVYCDARHCTKHHLY